MFKYFALLLFAVTLNYTVVNTPENFVKTRAEIKVSQVKNIKSSNHDKNNLVSDKTSILETI